MFPFVRFSLAIVGCSALFLIVGCVNSNFVPEQTDISQQTNSIETPTAPDETQQNASFDALRKADIQALAIALEMYYMDYSAFPENLNLLKDYMRSGIPVDPVTSQPYSYTVGTEHMNYILSTFLSDGTLYSESRNKK